MDGDAAPAGLPLQRLEQGGLADAGLPGEQEQRTGPAGRERVQPRPDHRQLAGPTDDDRRAGRHASRRPAGRAASAGADPDRRGSTAPTPRPGIRDRWSVQRRVLPEDALEEVVQPGRRVDAELVVEEGAEPAVHLEGLRRPPGPVERQHQQRAGLLPQWVVGGEALEPGQGVEVPADGEESREPALDRAEIGLGQLRDRALGGLVVGDVGERVPVPLPDRRVERGQRLLRPALPQVLAALLGAGGQPDRVHGLRRYVEGVPRSPGDQPAAGARRTAEGLAHVRHVRPQRHGRLRWRFAVPQLVDEPFGGHHPADVHQQEHQERALASGRDRDLGTVDDDAERTEDMEVDPALRREVRLPGGAGGVRSAAHPSLTCPTAAHVLRSPSWQRPAGPAKGRSGGGGGPPPGRGQASRRATTQPDTAVNSTR